ncbi:KDP operon transcriptional regulatory protein KdpE [Pseudomonas knackmussii B13]|uniref:KDP operon transcriptional regulatory protein KdpE n=1 Tax=Pseudomonas knackmussii (strain DSM 6978 / CCUG 54928 / LMG 23759 / B13) TaxID=1301098 RepID=A0A024HIY1_PSEKB|nr:response regulator [Pseudomonas knackmussii]CDF84413.1 KDP operon transcriptional regulatory protein KdpE [Pseudomonas knackmussii B13]
MNELPTRILVVEDDATIRRVVRMALEAEALEVYEAEGLQRGLLEAGSRAPDLIILDLGLPDGDGIELIRDLRTWSEVSIIVLSARDSEASKISALDSGADDYLAKPFGTGELLARVRSQLRRRHPHDSEAGAQVCFGGICIDLNRRSVERDGAPLHLTRLEYRLLVHLCTHPDRVLTHLHLLRAVWGPSHTEDTHYLRVFMANLRKKIEEEPARPRHLLTEVGVGYRFVP